MMTDLSIETANSGKVSFTVVEEMGRAIAAAERQALLDPEDGCASLRASPKSSWVIYSGVTGHCMRSGVISRRF